MALTCPTGFDVDRLREQVSETYERVVREPGGNFHFHRGLDYAVDFLKYDRQELEALPQDATERFAGVGNPHRIGDIEPGETVLDIGCGAGMDLLLAAKRTGHKGRAIGVDMTAGMRERAAESARKLGYGDVVEVRDGIAEELPVEDESVDVIITNGVLNLSPDKQKAFGEMLRVLRPGGRVYMADVVVTRELTLEARNDVDLWAA